ncbi:MAG TPA: hypothetical protein VD962_08010 [Rubricoccaceae bacterium]|nr:hypothetical protein [Rubricoccaceae bacterium]
MRFASLLLLTLLLLPAVASGQTSNDRLIAQALEDLGVSPDGRVIEAAVEEAFSQLYPRERYGSFRMNRTQARAIAYIAVLIAADGGRRGPSPVPIPTPGPYGCEEAVERTYDLVAEIPADPPGFGIFLTDDEKAAIRRMAPDIRRAAASCGCTGLADAALDLERLARNDGLVNRSDAMPLLERLRTQAVACR